MDSIRFNTTSNNLIVTIDNGISIGELPNDDVFCPYEILAELTLRTAIIDNITSNGLPRVITFGNGCKDENFNRLLNGFNALLKDTNLDCKLIGSSESNFPIKQSSLTVTVIGEYQEFIPKEETNVKYALIGSPLIGVDVLNNPDKIVKLNDIFNLKKVCLSIYPIGSKGLISAMKHFTDRDFNTTIDRHQSGGPSTSLLVRYNEEDYEEVMKYASAGFHNIDLI